MAPEHRLQESVNTLVPLYDSSSYDILCIPITSNNPSKLCFLNKNYLITIQTPMTPIVINRFLIENPFFDTVLNIIGLPIIFGSDLVCNKKLRPLLSLYCTSNLNKKCFENTFSTSKP